MRAQLIHAGRRQALLSTCACVRRALQFVPDGESRPRLAIEATEAYIACSTQENRRAMMATASAAAACAWRKGAGHYAWSAEAKAALAAREVALAAYDGLAYPQIDITLDRAIQRCERAIQLASEAAAASHFEGHWFLTAKQQRHYSAIERLEHAVMSSLITDYCQ